MPADKLMKNKKKLRLAALLMSVVLITPDILLAAEAVVSETTEAIPGCDPKVMKDIAAGSNNSIAREKRDFANLTPSTQINPGRKNPCGDIDVAKMVGLVQNQPGFAGMMTKLFTEQVNAGVRNKCANEANAIIGRAQATAGGVLGELGPAGECVNIPNSTITGSPTPNVPGFCQMLDTAIDDGDKPQNGSGNSSNNKSTSRSTLNSPLSVAPQNIAPKPDGAVAVPSTDQNKTPSWKW